MYYQYPTATSKCIVVASIEWAALIRDEFLPFRSRERLSADGFHRLIKPFSSPSKLTLTFHPHILYMGCTINLLAFKVAFRSVWAIALEGSL